MKIDPVFVLAPITTPPSMPTRRAFLLAAGTFAAGTVIGGACGYSMGSKNAGPADATATPSKGAAEAPAEIELKPSGDAELDYWRRLAVKAPLDDLFAELQPFLSARITDYQQDVFMWQGVARLAKEMVNNPTRPLREVDVFGVITHITSQARPEQPSLRELLPQLRLRREDARKRK